MLSLSPPVRGLRRALDYCTSFELRLNRFRLDFRLLGWGGRPSWCLVAWGLLECSFGGPGTLHFAGPFALARWRAEEARRWDGCLARWLEQERAADAGEGVRA